MLFIFRGFAVDWDGCPNVDSNKGLTFNCMPQTTDMPPYDITTLLIGQHTVTAI